MLSNENKKLTLSLVIPAFNEEGYLDLCLKAVAAQTIMPDEVIVVDNLSADRTRQIAASYPFVKLITEKKPGVLFARNCGFNAAKGDIIARIDSDTILPPRWVEYVKSTFAKVPTQIAITGPVSYYDMPLPNFNYQFDHFMRSSIYNWSPKSPFLFGSNMAISRRAWLGARNKLCADNYLHEDLDLAVHLYKSGQKIIYDKNLLSGASGRRYNDGLKRFYEYMRIYRQTYLRHGMHSLAIYLATGVFLLGYILVHPWLNIWYGVYGLLRPLIPLTRTSRKSPNW